MWKSYLTGLLLTGSTLVAQEQKPLQIDLTNLKEEIAPTMWGVFFEDINLGADGGIYAELIKNRSFEFYKPLMGWKTIGTLKQEGGFRIINRGLQAERNPRFLRVEVKNAGTGAIGLENEGFRGMGLKQNLRYDFSTWYRLEGKPITLHLELLNEQEQVVGTTKLQLEPADEWRKIESNLLSSATVPKGKFRCWMEGDGQLDLDMISLFPSDTWKGRKGGLRQIWCKSWQI